MTEPVRSKVFDRRARRATMLTLLVPVACAQDAAPPAGATDDAPPGVTVHEAVATNHALSFEETLRIGLVNGPREFLFGTIADIEVDPASGEVFVLDSQSKSVRVYDLTGRFKREFGGSGQGPGEFEYPIGLAVTADTVAVADRHAVQVFGVDGEYQWGRTLERVGTLRTPEQFGHSYSGWRVLAHEIALSGSLAARVHIRVYPLGPQGRDESEPVFQVAPRTQEVLLPDGRTANALLEHLVQVALDDFGRIHVAPSDEYVIEIYTPDGSLERIHRFESDRVPVSRRDVERFKAEMERGCREVTAPRECDEYVNEVLPAQLAVGVPEHVPVIEELLVSDEGHALVQRRDVVPDPFQPPERTVYDLITAEGEFVGRFEPPDGFTPKWFTESEIWGVQRDELGVSYVVRLEVR